MKVEIFGTMLDRIIDLSLDLERVKAAEVANANRIVSLSSERRVDVADVFNLISYLSSDKKLEAIKAYRNLTGAGLVDSKAAIESVMNRFVT